MKTDLVGKPRLAGMLSGGGGDTALVSFIQTYATGRGCRGCLVAVTGHGSELGCCGSCQARREAQLLPHLRAELTVLKTRGSPEPVGLLGLLSLQQGPAGFAPRAAAFGVLADTPRLAGEGNVQKRDRWGG